MVITQEASEMIGTTASLEEGDTLSYLQLMYGMMLPSGNDAAFTIAEYFSNMLFDFKYCQLPIKEQEKIRSFSYERHPIRFFLREMNVYAKELGMKDTHFDSPHGLANRFN